MQFQLPLIGIAAILATPAAAQQTAPGSIPIYDITPPVQPTPTPTPVVTPTPRATPTSRATPTARATAAAPRPAATSTPRATPAVTPTPRATPAPVATAAAPVVVPATVPTPVATPDPLPTSDASPTAEPSPANVATDTAPATGGDALPWWVWFLGGIIVASLAAWLIGRLRGGRVQEVYEVPPVVPAEPVAIEPVPVVPVPVVPPVAPAAPRAAPLVTPPSPSVAPLAPAAPVGPFLEFQLAPLRVGMEGDRALLDFDLTVGNPASMPVAEVSVATVLLTANAGQDEQIAAFFANDAKRGLDPFALGGGERRHLEATMTLPRVAVNTVTANDRAFFVPMIAIDARYRWEDGRESRTTAAFMVGPAAPNGKLAPIFTDRGDRMVDRLEVRLHGMVRRT